MLPVVISVALRCVLYMGMGKVISQQQMDIVQDMRQQDKIINARLNHNKYSSPYGRRGDRGKEAVQCVCM